MIRQLVVGLLFVTANVVHAQESVCNLFSHLESADGSQIVITGDLIIAKDLAVLGAEDCENRYISGSGVRHWWPTALSLSPSSSVTPDQLQKFEKAAADADNLRSQGKTVNASASFSGRIKLVRLANCQLS